MSIEPDGEAVWKRRVAALVLGAALFSVLALLSLTFAREAGRVAAIWPANGALLALILLRPGTDRVWLLAGAFLGNVGAAFLMKDAWPIALGLSAANVVEVGLVAWLLRDLPIREALLEIRTLVRFALAGGVIGPAASAVVAAATLALWHHEPVGPNILRWLITDALGMLIVAPPLLLMASRGAWERTVSARERAAMAVLLAGALGVVFLQTSFPLLFLIPPVLMLIALRCGPGSASVALLIATAASLIAVATGYGPIALIDGGLDQRAMVQQLFLAVLVFTTLPVAALVKERAESEARYRLMADRASDIIVTYGADGRIHYVSPSVEAPTGLSPETLIGGSIARLVHPDDVEDLMEAFHDLVRTDGASARGRVRYRAATRDGSIRWLEARTTLIRDEGGRIVELHGALRDITATKALEDELIAARDAAEAATRAKSDFLANMSHELRTPLTSVIGFSGLLKDSPALPEAERLYADRIATASEALLGVINDILDYSKLEAEAVDLDPRPFDPAETARAAAAIVEAQCAAKALTLTLDLDPDLPRALMGDDIRLRQVLLNFLSNAAKFTVSGEIRLETRWSDGRLRAAVTDSGIGIAADKLDSLFERFTQADASTTRTYGGTGLGLAISRRLIEMMGGEIGATSRPGEGSTFWFEVPLPVAEAGEAHAAGAAPDLPKGLRVLMADDAPANRELVKVILAQWGVDLETVENGAEAAQAAARGKYDLILMDVHMPVMDGMDAARSIRALPGRAGRVPILALTANVQPEQVEACRTAGMDGHVGKPIQVAELISAMAAAARRRRARAPDEQIA